MSEYWWKDWHRHRFLSEFFGFVLSALFHLWSRLINLSSTLYGLGTDSTLNTLQHIFRNMLMFFKHLTCTSLDSVRLWVLSDSNFSESRSISVTRKRGYHSVVHFRKIWF